MKPGQQKPFTPAESAGTKGCVFCKVRDSAGGQMRLSSKSPAEQNTIRPTTPTTQKIGVSPVAGVGAAVADGAADGWVTSALA